MTPLSPIAIEVAPHLVSKNNRQPRLDKIICNDCVPSSVLDLVVEPRFASYNPWNSFSNYSEMNSVSDSSISNHSPVPINTTAKPQLHSTSPAHKEVKEDGVRSDIPKRSGKKEYKNREPTPKISRAVKETLRSIEKNQKELAAEVGTSTTTISSYLTGKIRSKGWTKLEQKLQHWMKKQRALNNVSDFSEDLSDMEESEPHSNMAHDDVSSSEGSEVDNSMESDGSNGFQYPFRPSDYEVGVVYYNVDLPRRGSEFNFGVSVM